LTDPDSVAAAMKGARRVYHVAAAVKEWVRDWSVFDRVNVEAYESLLNIAMNEGVERIVHTSSFMALGHSDRDTVADETLRHEPDHFHNPYERTKLQASLLDEKYAQKGAPIVTVITGVIFGPGELTAGNLVVEMFIDMAKGKFPGIPGNGKQIWSYSFVRDVADGHILAMKNGKVGESYVLGGENITMNHLIASAANELGIKTPKMHLPLWLLTGSAFFMEQIAKLTGKNPMLTVGKVGVLGHHWAYSSQKAADQLGYAITPFPEALKITVDWLKESGLLSS